MTDVLLGVYGQTSQRRLAALHGNQMVYNLPCSYKATGYGVLVCGRVNSETYKIHVYENEIPC